MTNIFQVSHILQFILGAFGVILLISYMTDFSLPLSFPVSKCNIQRATLRVQYGKCYTVFCRSDFRYFYVLAINTIQCIIRLFGTSEKMETPLTISARSSILDF